MYNGIIRSAPMKSFLTVLIALILILTCRAARADSPITSTDFHTAYLDLALVEKADANGVIDGEIAAYLCDSAHPIDIKAAILNALGWKFEGKNNAELFSWYLAAKYGMRAAALNLDVLNDGELFSLAYLTALDDYFHPEKAVPLIDSAERRFALHAKTKPRGSFTVSLIRALIHAQAAFDSDWCALWRLTEDAVDKSPLKRDMRPEAVTIITEYMSLYRNDCR